MIAAELVNRVTLTGLGGTAVLSVVAAVVGGASAAIGVAGGGLITLLNFRWLARDAIRATTGEGRLSALGLRKIAALLALGGLVACGVTHPVAVAAGLLVLPPVLVAQGLLAARD
jgi:ATP synthase I chain